MKKCITISVLGVMLLTAMAAFVHLNNTPYKDAWTPPRLEADVLPISAPRVIEVGEMLKLSAEGELVKWRCFPQTDDCEVYGDHELSTR